MNGKFVIGKIVSFWYGNDIEPKCRLGIMIEGERETRIHVLSGELPWKKYRKGIPLSWIRKYYKSGGISLLKEEGSVCSEDTARYMEIYPKNIPNPFDFLEGLEKEELILPYDISLRFRILAQAE